MPQFQVKSFNELTIFELKDIYQLRSEVFVVEQQCVYQDIDEKDSESFHLIGYENEQLVAYARLLPEGVSYESYSAIGRVCIKKEYRRKQYGILLMNEAIAYCKDNFCFPIKISAQQYLEKFYQGFGFITISEPYLEDDIPHIAMVRN